MGLGGTAKKLQKVTNAAEDLYVKMNEVVGQVKELRDEVERTSTQVDRMERDLAKQRALVDAIAEAQGIDLEAAVEDADLPPAPDAADEDAEGESASSGADDGAESGA